MIRTTVASICLCAVLAGAFCASGAVASGARPGKAPSFAAVTMGGQKVSLDLAGGRRYLVLTFFGVSCKPCQKELALLNESWKSAAFREKAEMYAINADGYDAERLRREMAARGLVIDFPVVPDDNQVITNQYVNGMIPLTLVIDRNETIVMSFLGAKAGAVQKMEALITEEKDVAAK